jgi:hypothetical protein
MAHALNNVSLTSVCSELGITRGNDRTLTSLTRHASINKWSFYRPGSIAPDGSDYIQLTAPSNNDKLGDFRGYNHSAVTPYTPADYNNVWGPGGTYVTFTFLVYLNELNIKEIFPSTTPYLSVKYYMSSSNRNSQASSVRTYTVAVSLTSNSPPSGHSNNQTQKVASASQLLTDTLFQSGFLTNPDDVVYCDIYFSDSSGNQVARFGSTLADGHVDVATHERQTPWVDSVGTCVSRSGYTGSRTEINNLASSCTGSDVNLSIGSSSYSFYLRAVGISSGLYNINPTSCTVQMVHYRRQANGSYSIIQTKTLGTSINLNTFSKNGKQIASGTYGNMSNTFQYDDYIKVNITAVNTWGTAYAC